MTGSRLEPFFLQSKAGRIFCLLRAPESAQRCVLLVPPFGEEMNKSRRQFTITSQALTDKGFAVLLVDLFGTGDSEGEFSDARWDRWKADVAAALDWIDDSELALEAIVATRLGCALAAETLKETGRRVTRSVFWQPVDSGRQFMTQFLRLRVAGSMMEADRKETVEGLKQRLQAGETLEIAGYALSPALFTDIESRNLTASLDPCLGQLALIEVGRAREGELSPAGKRLMEAAVKRGLETTSARIAGDPFWSATEIVVNDELAQATVRFVDGEDAA